jgi:hypothetical protein
MFVPAYYCDNCKERLSFNQVHQSDGVCPECGAVSPGSVVGHFKDALEVGTDEWTDEYVMRRIESLNKGL